MMFSMMHQTTLVLVPRDVKMVVSGIQTISHSLDKTHSVTVLALLNQMMLQKVLFPKNYHKLQFVDTNGKLTKDISLPVVEDVAC